MDPIYVLVTNSSNTIVGKNVYTGISASTITQDQMNYPNLSFNIVDQQTFVQAIFVGPNYILAY